MHWKKINSASYLSQWILAALWTIFSLSACLLMNRTCVISLWWKKKSTGMLLQGNGETEEQMAHFLLCKFVILQYYTSSLYSVSKINWKQEHGNPFLLQIAPTIQERCFLTQCTSTYEKIMKAYSWVYVLPNWYNYQHILILSFKKKIKILIRNVTAHASM